MKVCKFGGSSVADEHQIRKILNIINNDSERKYIIVSAPGKRFKEDVKVTDMFIALVEGILEGSNYDEIIEQILNRYKQIENGLEVNHSLISHFNDVIHVYINHYKNNPNRLTDALKVVEKILMHN